jgi:hypothetical protein
MDEHPLSVSPPPLLYNPTSFSALSSSSPKSPSGMMEPFWHTQSPTMEGDLLREIDGSFPEVFDREFLGGLWENQDHHQTGNAAGSAFGVLDEGNEFAFTMG